MIVTCLTRTPAKTQDFARQANQSRTQFAKRGFAAELKLYCPLVEKTRFVPKLASQSKFGLKDQL